MESVSFTFSYDKNSDQSLIKLWKLTNDKSLCTPLQSSKRLSNRSWRLINHRILHHKNSNTSRKYSLADLDSSHSLSNLQDIKPSRPSLFSHTSNLSLYTRKRSTQTSLESASFALSKQQKDQHDSSCEILNVIQDEDESEDHDLSDVSDISDISEFSEDEDEEEDEVSECDSPVLHTQNSKDTFRPLNEKNSNDQTTAELPSTPQTSQKSQTTLSSVSKNNNMLRRSIDDRISPRNVDHTREPSMTKFYIANSPSPTEKKSVDNDESNQLQPQKSDTSQLDAQEKTRHFGEQGSLFNNFQFKEKAIQVDDDEEDDEYDDDEEGDNDSDFSTDISEDDSGLSEVDDEEMEEEPEEKEIMESRSKQQDKNTLNEKKTYMSTTNDNESDWLSVSTDSVQSSVPIQKNLKQQTQPMNFPKVDPSSTASLATIPIEVSNNNNNSQTSLSQLKRPKSLLSNLFLNQLATTNIEPINHLHPHSHLHSAKHQSLLLGDVRDKPTLQRSRTTGIITVDREMKRPSIIFTRKFPSVADINLPSLTPTDSNNTAAPQTPLTKQASIVGISDINVSIKPTEEKSWSEEGSVSASASLLSTSLNKLTTSSSHHSIKNLLSKSSLNITKLYHSNKTKQKDNSVFQKRNDELAKPESKHDNLKQSPSSLTSSSSILMVSQKSSSTPPPHPVLPRITTTEHDLNNELLNNEELSKSLKDSILIDNKLGKIALPEKVIDAEIFLRRESRLVDSDDFDDYHAKGW